MKNIIVPVDFSEQSEHALKVAAAVAKRDGGKLYVLHMLEISRGIVSDGPNIPQVQIVHLIKLTEQRLSSFLDKPYLQNIQVIPMIKHYKVFSEVNEIAEAHQADLIVMGSHGVDGLNEIFIGSNTERVVRNAEVPVLVVKGAVESFEPETFVFACDFEEESLESIKKAMDFTKNLNANLKLVYINTPGDAFMSTNQIYGQITKVLKKGNLDLPVDIFNDYSVEKGILNYAEHQKADLIGIPTHGRKGLSHFFMGSIGEDVANHSEIPVVTFKISK